MFLPLLWTLVTVSPGMPMAPPDVLVICPAELRPALAPWEAYRRGQGHVVRVVDAPPTVVGVESAITDAYRQGGLRYVVLVGDVAGDRQAVSSGTPPVVPTQYRRAHVNVHWGSTPTIATDGPYADVDGDRRPDLAIGRIPADSSGELAAFVEKVIRYERQTSTGAWQRRINVAAGVGGFGPLADRLIDMAARSVFSQTVPAGYNVRATLAGSSSRSADDLRHAAQRDVSGDCLAWIYLGHGLPTELDHVVTPAGEVPILSVDDVAQLRGGAARPLAVLVACYTGALDARHDCLAERLVMAQQGPVAVVAATRVTMPYGNTVLGCELLRACFAEPEARLGDVWRRALCQSLAEAPADDPLRTSLDALARSLSPPLAFAGQTTNEEGRSWQPADLATERQEHAWMYQLLGDPLLRLQRPGALELESPADVAAGEALTIASRSDVVGHCTVELVPAGALAGDQPALATSGQPVETGSFRAKLTLPDGIEGRYMVRAFVSGANDAALGATDVTIHRPPQRVSQADTKRLAK